MSVSAETIEAEINKVISSWHAAADSGAVGLAAADLDWEMLEGGIRQAVLNAGGTALPPTFFFQFGDGVSVRRRDLSIPSSSSRR
jgi:hypothetical protein